MTPAKVSIRRPYILTVVCLLLALFAWTSASVWLGQAIELGLQTSPALADRRTNLLVGAAIAGLLALVFALAAARRSTHRSAHGEGTGDCVPTSAASDWRRWQQVTDDVPIAISYFDASETCQFANESARRQFGIAPSADMTFSLRTALGAGEHERHAQHWQAVKAGQCVTFDAVDPHSDVHHTIHLTPDFDDHGAVQGFCLRMVDVTDTRAAERARAEGERHLKSITDNMPALITYVNTDRVVTFANATFKTWLGSDPTRMIGRPLVELIGEDMYRQRLGFLSRGFAGEQFSFELRSKTAGGERDLHTTYIPDLRPDGTVAGIFVLVTDVTPMRDVERQLHQLARIDTLTQLSNRRLFDEKLAEALARARRHGKTLALLFMDIDHFKPINDTYGHAVGDAVLVEFAARLKACQRETDTVARQGGDEFVILIEALGDASEATCVAERIHARLQVPMSIEGHELVVTSSIGIALVDDADDSPAAVMAKADAALYSAKRAGRNCYAVAGKVASMAVLEPGQA